MPESLKPEFPTIESHAADIGAMGGSEQTETTRDSTCPSELDRLRQRVREWEELANILRDANGEVQYRPASYDALEAIVEKIRDYDRHGLQAMFDEEDGAIDPRFYDDSKEEAELAREALREAVLLSRGVKPEEVRKATEAEEVGPVVEYQESTALTRKFLVTATADDDMQTSFNTTGIPKLGSRLICTRRDCRPTYMPTIREIEVHYRAEDEGDALNLITEEGE